MKIIVIGATGRVGSNIVAKLAKHPEDEVYAGARQPEKIPANDHVTPFALDLSDKMDDIKEALPEADAIIFAAGSGGRDLLKIDLHGAVKVMQAAEEKEINRFVMLSSKGSLSPDEFADSPLENYLIAKYYADEWLIHNTHLDYTILQPTTLVEKTGSGKVTLGAYSTNENSIDNVADVLIGLVENHAGIKEVIEMSTGNEPIPEAINELN
ncbi:putative sugar epimerase YhfK [Lentilactobacillus parabuchneri]|jgi:nucleoside-diphosphate-sugar epimerase|uniref:NAD(P)H-binding protein n=3 Tax=Lentilactobacillus parabuchneri TaxID=152331 RepID=A0A1X1FGP9_9LACO|nr:NAD(P)H-binding protein [Lentilactobacillus parabuchneri]APR06817.1 putative sugar epimerase YhfK [Lentilactobacillus parabuchneri]KRM46900.1 NAD-dependent epimerase dehydratase [Lentilactobacillus parabuchneri DSM 5707 = NBRC 107865]KRN78186.1 NAD-dependent epimerase dehydratase [Lentilactobacillus parabuchneri]MBW0222569.1 SDR family oxidoreductase [Lentilactobacillus parabuchneri]MBW0245843.1 SDR family oxidoreductase [Lentilactobacillus parabuchneri]